MAWEETAYGNGGTVGNGDGGDDIHGKMTFSGKRLKWMTSPTPGCGNLGPKRLGEGRRRCCGHGESYENGLKSALSLAPQNSRR